MLQAIIVLPHHDRFTQFDNQNWFEDRLTHWFNGFTRSDTYGAWRNNADEIERKTGWMYLVVLCEDELETLRSVLRDLRHRANQDCIFLTTTPITVEYVS